MRRVAVLACAAALVSVPAALSGSASYPPLLGMAIVHGTNRLVWLDPLTLKVRGQASLKLPAFSSWRQSPDGSRLVFVAWQGTLRFVDAKGLRMVGSVRLPGMIQSDVVWVSSRLLVVYDTLEIAAVDPVSMRVLWRERVPQEFNPFYPQGAASTPGGVIILLSPADGSVGPTTVLSVDASGRIRTVKLAQIQSGATQDPSGASLFTGASPGLAVDPVGGRAYVVGGDGTVAAVDLSTLTVGYHDQSRTLAIAEKVLSGPTRDALWLGNGLLAVTGENDRAWIDANGKYQESVKPAGLTIVDTQTWTTKMVDPGASAVAFANGLLLASGQTWETTRGQSGLNPQGDGLTAYSTAGAAAFHLLGQTPVQQVRAANGLGYAWRLPPNLKGHVKTTIFDIASGRVLETLVGKDRHAPVPLIAF
jgi:hypothetical protein